MRRWGLAGVAMGLVAVGSAPATAVESDWGGAGAVAGTIDYAQPLPTYLQACKKIAFSLSLEAPAFALQTPSGPQVVPLSVQGTGTEDCGSETVGGGGLSVRIDAGDLHCNAPGAFTRVGKVITYIAGARDCRWGAGGTAPGYGWVFELVSNNGTVAGTATWAPV